MTAGTNNLKDVDVRTLEKAIAKAVSELVGAELTCRIDDISYTDSSNEGGATFNASISQQPRQSKVKNRI